MSSNIPVRPDIKNKLNLEEERRGRVIEASEDEEEQVATKRRRDDDEEMVAARKRSANKAQSAEETSPERRRVEEDLAKFGVEAAKFEEEARTVKAPPVPTTPSREEVAAHRLTHRPFRSWCPHCIRGKGRADQHRRSTQKDQETSIPKLVSDYFFIGRRRPPNEEDRRKEEEEAEKEGQTPIIVLKDTSSKAIFAHACPCKGAHESVVTRIVADLENLGYKRVLVRTDGEPAILALWDAVKARWGGEIVKVESATGVHNSNADAEQAVQKVEDEVRTWKDAVEDAVREKIPPTHDILAWMVEHAM